MEDDKNSIEKICCLYASNWHLSVMLLPYLNRQINEDVEIATIFKNDINENVNELVKKLNLRNSEKLLKINYEKQQKIDYKNIEKIFNKIDFINKKIIIVTNGNNIEVDEINLYIEEYLSKQKNENKKIKVINCYDVVNIKNSMDDIISNYNIILNTAGEKNMDELFV